MKYHLEEDFKIKMATALDGRGFSEHKCDYEYWEREALERLDNYKELEFVVWFGLQIVQQLLSNPEDECLEITEYAFEKPCEKYKELQYLWFESTIQTWAKKTQYRLKGENKKKFDDFFEPLLKEKIPDGYTQEDYIRFVEKECMRNEYIHYFGLYERVCGKKIALNLKDENARKIYKNMLESVRLDYNHQRYGIKDVSFKEMDYIEIVIDPEEFIPEIAEISKAFFAECENLLVLEKARERGWLCEAYVDIYMEEAFKQKKYGVIPYYIYLKNA